MGDADDFKFLYWGLEDKIYLKDMFLISQQTIRTDIYFSTRTYFWGTVYFKNPEGPCKKIPQEMKSFQPLQIIILLIRVYNKTVPILSWLKVVIMIFQIEFYFERKIISLFHFVPVLLKSTGFIGLITTKDFWRSYKIIMAKLKITTLFIQSSLVV
jgi:hypothetical protein